ncbi:hypothetical protein ACJX0J_032723, partial [Zea mays]
LQSSEQLRMRPSENMSRFTGSMQNQSSDHNISKRSRSPTLSYEDADGTKAHVNTGGNSR